MDGRKKTLLVLLAGVLLAAVGLWWLTGLSARSEKAGGSVCPVTPQTLRCLQYTYQGQTLTLEYEAGSWTLAEDPAYHLDASACNAMLTALMGLEPQRRLEPVSGQDYGLAEPLVRLRVITTEGENLAFAFGAQNSITDQIYLQVEGQAALCLVPARRAAPFTKTKEQLFEPFSPAGITASEIEMLDCTLSDGRRYRLQKLQTPDPAGGYAAVWQLDGQQTLEPDRVQGLLSAVTSYAAGQYTGAEPAEYGLDTPDVQLKVRTPERDLVFCYALGADGCYLSLAGDDSIYRVDLSVLDTIAAWGRG